MTVANFIYRLMKDDYYEVVKVVVNNPEEEITNVNVKIEGKEFVPYNYKIVVEFCPSNNAVIFTNELPKILRVLADLLEEVQEQGKNKKGE